MHIVALIFGCMFLAGVLLDAFQTIILPRRPVGRFRITRVFFVATWGPWTWLTGHWPVRRSREHPARRRDGWSTVAELRSPSAIADRLTAHVSAQSTASHLESRD